MVGSKTTQSKTHFGLANLKDDTTSGLIKAKHEKGVNLPLCKRSHVDLTVKASGSRKRKTSEAVHFSLENLSIEDAFGKLSSFSEAVR